MKTECTQHCQDETISITNFQTHVEPRELFKSRGTIRVEHCYKISTVPLAPNKLQRSQKDNSLNVKTFTLVKFGKTIFPIQFGLPFRRDIKTNE